SAIEFSERMKAKSSSSPQRPALSGGSRRLRGFLGYSIRRPFMHVAHMCALVKASAGYIGTKAMQVLESSGQLRRHNRAWVSFAEARPRQVAQIRHRKCHRRTESDLGPPPRHKKTRKFAGLVWWLWVDSNHRPQHYECCALTG